MSSYTQKEILIAKYLEKTPALKRLVKYLYTRFSYLVNFNLNKVLIDDSWELKDPFFKINGQTFFGYYDKPSINDNGDLLTHVVSDGVCKIYIKTSTGEVDCLTSTEAWNWQQGAMLTWLDSDKFAFNNIISGDLVCCIFSLGEGRVVDIYTHPIQCYSQEKNFFASISYQKLNKLRPEYGYEKIPRSPFDDNDGIKILDISTGSCNFEIKLDEIIFFLRLRDSVNQSKINHCQFSPNGNLVLFMYRAYRKDGKYSYLLAWDYSNGKLIKLMENRVVSHYSWVDNNEIIVWGRGEAETGYHIVNLDGECKFIKVKDPLLLGDGHPSVCSKTKKILTDTYPNKARISTLFFLEGANEEKVVQLKQPWKFNGPSRVDLHPRFNHDCSLITLESGHSGYRRQYILKRKNN